MFCGGLLAVRRRPPIQAAEHIRLASSDARVGHVLGVPRIGLDPRDDIHGDHHIPATTCMGSHADAGWNSTIASGFTSHIPCENDIVLTPSA